MIRFVQCEVRFANGLEAQLAGLGGCKKVIDQREESRALRKEKSRLKAKRSTTTKETLKG